MSKQQLGMVAALAAARPIIGSMFDEGRMTHAEDDALGAAFEAVAAYVESLESEVRRLRDLLAARHTPTSEEA